MVLMSVPAAIPLVTGRHRNRTLATARQARAIQLATEGRTYQEIADELGYANRGTVHHIVHDALTRDRKDAVELHQQAADTAGSVAALMPPAPTQASSSSGSSARAHGSPWSLTSSRPAAFSCSSGSPQSCSRESDEERGLEGDSSRQVAQACLNSVAGGQSNSWIRVRAGCDVFCKSRELGRSLAYAPG